MKRRSDEEERAVEVASKPISTAGGVKGKEGGQSAGARRGGRSIIPPELKDSSLRFLLVR
ncbi:MAG: hypothetical protein WC548_01635 [Candidatus Pacearchaeota archaeon]